TRRALLVVTRLRAFKGRCRARRLDVEQREVCLQVGKIIAMLRRDLFIKARVGAVLGGNCGRWHMHYWSPRRMAIVMAGGRGSTNTSRPAAGRRMASAWPASSAWVSATCPAVFVIASANNSPKTSTNCTRIPARGVRGTGVGVLAAFAGVTAKRGG